MVGLYRAGIYKYSIAYGWQRTVLTACHNSLVRNGSLRSMDS